MEGNERELSTFFHHQSNTATATAVASPTNSNAVFGIASSDASLSLPLPQSPSHAPYPHSHVQAQKKKRGRPRKYESPQHALAAKKLATTSSFPSSKKSHSSSSLLGTGSVGQGFSPHVITVAAEEDVGQRIMSFMQQSRCAMCILSASGSISNASLRQPATSGGSITIEGQFEIVSLSGSYVLNEQGTWTGGLSICLSNTDGQLVGGGIVGPLKAAGPVQVIVGTFLIDPEKDASAGIKGDVSTSRWPPPVGEPVTSFDFHSVVNTSNGNPTRGNEAHQAIGGDHFMLQQGGLHMTPHLSDWGGSPDSRNAGFELTGRISHGAHQSPENGDYDQGSE